MAESTKKPNIFQRWARSFKDMRGEMKKVVWPTKKQILNNVLVTLACVLVVGIFIWIIDPISTFVVDGITYLVHG